MKCNGWASSILKGNLILITGQRLAEGRGGVSGLPLFTVQPRRCQHGSKTPFFTCPSTRWTQAEPHGHQQSTNWVYLLAWDTERAIDWKGAGEGWWSKGFSLFSYTVEPILPVCHTEREGRKISPKHQYAIFGGLQSRISKFTQIDLGLSEATAYFRAGYHTVHGIFLAQL